MGVWWGQGKEARGIPKGAQTAPHLLPLISLDYVPDLALRDEAQHPRTWGPVGDTDTGR